MTTSNLRMTLKFLSDRYVDIFIALVARRVARMMPPSLPALRIKKRVVYPHEAVFAKPKSCQEKN